MMKPVRPTMRATPIDGTSVFTQVESLLQKQKLTRTTRQEPVIFITRNDKKRLWELLTVAKSMDLRDRVDLNGLAVKLKRAFGVDAREVAGDIITMNSRAELVDVDTGEKVKFAVVFPRDADIETGRISVLAPLGAAMLGYRVGDEFAWEVPYGRRRFKVTQLLYQPEAAGQYANSNFCAKQKM
jgi:regulator of nucleoside diphosphate kinase